MLDEVARLERLVAVEREIARRREARPLDTMQWLPGQLALLMSQAKRKLFRAGVQAQGKTTGGAAECLFRAEGRHPFKLVPPPPTYQWVTCATERQAGIVQRKLWELTPKDDVAPGCYFDPRKGAFVGKYPKLMFRNGSWIEFRTGHGDPTNLASDTLHHVWVDEPPENERAFNELLKRLLRKNGDMTLTFTPVNRPVDYLKKKCEDGLIEDLHFDLRPEHLKFPSGRTICLEDGTPCDQAWIDALIAETSDMEVPVVIHGEWEFRVEGAYFAKVWDPAQMIRREPPRGTYEELLGIDFGDRPGKQLVGYIMVDERGGARGYPHIHVADEYVGETGRETNEDDARNVLAMLRRRRTKWADLKAASADRAHKAGRSDQKSAASLARAIANELGIEDVRHLVPPITVAKRGEGRGGGSVLHRWRWLHGQMARGNLTVHPRCERLIEAIPKASPWSDDDWKDPVDYLAYGVDRYTYERRHGGAPVEVW